MNRAWAEKYKRYLQSPEWDIVRSLAISRNGDHCLKCGSTEKLQANHIRYPDNVWDTSAQDLETLCFLCHKAYHQAKGKLKTTSWDEHLNQMTVFPLSEAQITVLKDLKRFVPFKSKTRRNADRIMHRYRLTLLSSAKQTDQTTAPAPERPRDVHAAPATLTGGQDNDKFTASLLETNPSSETLARSHTPSIFAAPPAAPDTAAKGSLCQSLIIRPN